MNEIMLSIILIIASILFCIAFIGVLISRNTDRKRIYKKIAMRSCANLCSSSDDVKNISSLLDEIKNNKCLCVDPKAMNSGPNPCEDEIDNIECSHDESSLRCVIDRKDIV